ncbi:MAG: ATP-dependent DNA helicase RecQ [Saprospiraceae bacterium]|nr:ATP-dependent DNA helicase RecQ [Saprospiraceae bacterium]MBP6739704.1 ATP-dependent DNA helicase RecQ [Leptospiraceae bacterium]
MDKKILEKYFPEIQDVRDYQQNAITSILNGKNTLCLMPTGSGKSFIYQYSGIFLNKTTIVISPLIALMKQQSERLASKGLKCFSFLESNSSIKQYNEMKSLYNSEVNFIFISPERAAFEGYLEFILKKMKDKIGLIVIDEAHCISQWGDSFRPAYKMIPIFLERIFLSDWPKILCLTATLNPKDQNEICVDFKIGNNIIKTQSLLRTNIDLKFLTNINNDEDKVKQIKEIINRFPHEKVLVYVYRKKGEFGTKELAEKFKAENIQCDYFDADISDDHKSKVLLNFENGNTKLVFATNAFGMGIDIPDIRVIIHFHTPESVEQYYQEAGRSGRDGKDSYAFLFYSKKSSSIRKRMISESFLSQEKIMEAFLKISHRPRNTNIGCVNVWEELNDLEKTALYYFSKVGVISIIEKGVRFLNCFQQLSHDIDGNYQKYKTISANMNVLLVKHKTNDTIEDIHKEFFTLFTEGKLKLIKAPNKVVFYNVNRDELSQEIIEEILNLQQEIKEYKIQSYEKIVNAIENNIAPINLIKDGLGL